MNCEIRTLVVLVICISIKEDHTLVGHKPRRQCYRPTILGTECYGDRRSLQRHGLRTLHLFNCPRSSGGICVLLALAE